MDPGYLFFAFPAAAPTDASLRRMRWRAALWPWWPIRARPQELAARWIEVEHGRQALALAARNFYGKPDERLGLTGITGTNGKTTTALSDRFRIARRGQ